MKKIIRNIEDLKSLFTKLKDKIDKEPFTIQVDNLFSSKSNKQLRSYWLLIKVCKLWMNEQGNNFSDEEVSYYFKIKAGHYQDIDGVKIAKSISDSSATTKKDMENLINIILDFGVENDIDGCEITSYELKDLLINYKD